MAGPPLVQAVPVAEAKAEAKSELGDLLSDPFADMAAQEKGGQRDDYRDSENFGGSDGDVFGEDMKGLAGGLGLGTEINGITPGPGNVTKPTQGGE